MKSDQPRRDLGLLKQGLVGGIFLMAVIFGSDIRGIFGTDSSETTERIIWLESQNNEHGRLEEQIGRHSQVILGMQKTQYQLIAQMEKVTDIVSAMQQREFAGSTLK